MRKTLARLGKHVAVVATFLIVALAGAQGVFAGPPSPADRVLVSLTSTSSVTVSDFGISANAIVVSAFDSNCQTFRGDAAFYSPYSGSPAVIDLEPLALGSGGDGCYMVGLFQSYPSQTPNEVAVYQRFGGMWVESQFGFEDQIVSVSSPLNYSSQSTSVTFSVSYFVPAARVYNSTHLTLYVANQSSTTVANINDIRSFKFPLVVDSLTSISTSTVLNNDSRYMWYFVLDGHLDNGQNLASVPFYTGDHFFQFTTGAFDPTAGKVFDLSSCNVLSGFDMGDCLYNLVLPNETSLSAVFAQARDVYGHAWPIGYVTRFVQILASTTPVQPPVVTLSLPVGPTLHMDPWDSLMGTSSMLGQAHASWTINGVTVGDGRSFRDITEPYWIVLCYLFLGGLILRDILKHKV